MSSSPKNDINKLVLENLNLEDKSFIFSIKPNLRYKENIVKDFNNDYWIFDNYDIYYKKVNNKNIAFEAYIVYSSDDNDNINIVRIHDKKLIKELKGHNNVVNIVKHFYKENEKKNYLLSFDYSKLLFVWDLDKYQKIHEINTYYTKYIFSFMIITEKDYIITSTEGKKENNSTNVYSLKEGKFKFSFKDSINYETLYLLLWKYNCKYYIIELCYKKILIYDLSSTKLCKTLKPSQSSNYFYSGFISSDNIYLFTCSHTGNIYVWNLIDSNLVFNINIKNSSFLKMILWSKEIKDSINGKKKKINNYILVSDKRKNGFLCINISFERKNIQKTEKFIDSNFDYSINSFYRRIRTIKCIKKIFHPIYGESLLSSNDDKSIDLWNNIINSNSFY